jgi:hypothetical protein
MSSYQTTPFCLFPDSFKYLIIFNLELSFFTEVRFLDCEDRSICCFYFMFKTLDLFFNPAALVENTVRFSFLCFLYFIPPFLNFVCFYFLIFFPPPTHLSYWWALGFAQLGKILLIVLKGTVWYSVTVFLISTPFSTLLITGLAVCFVLFRLLESLA